MTNNSKPQIIRIIWAHPRTDSLTANVVAAIKDEAKSHGADVTEVDLYRENFNPVLGVEDEPDFHRKDNTYSDEVTRHAEAILNSDAVIFVFPLWWWSLPAMLKGFIDRVWNNNLLYYRPADSPTKLPSIRWVAISATQKKLVPKEAAVRELLAEGIASFSGFDDVDMTFLTNSWQQEKVDDVEEHYKSLLDKGRQTVRDLYQ